MSETIRLTPSPQPSPPAVERELAFPWPIDLGLTVASHGWVRLEPWRWEGATGTLSHAERIGGRAGTIAVQQHDPRTLAVAWDGLPDDSARISAAMTLGLTWCFLPAAKIWLP